MSFPELTNIQIDNYYSGNPKYGGCISKDQVDMLIPGKFYILNMDRIMGPGTHWVLLYLVNKNEAIYFDSFGLPPPERISYYSRRFKNSRIRNIGQIQDIKSSSCGWYCLYVADRLLGGDSYIDIIESFDTKGNSRGMRENEEILKRYFL